MITADCGVGFSVGIFCNRINKGACEVECPKEISLENIARMNREYLNASFTSEEV